MKNILAVILIIVFTTCKAQVIVPLTADPNPSTSTYYKDIDGEMNKFVGMWVYNSGGTSLTIVLQKREMLPFDNNFEDLLVGGYIYTVNGVTIVNTLPMLNNSTIEGFEQSIAGRWIYPNNLFARCDDCGANERRLTLGFRDPERPHLRPYVVLRYIIGANPEKIEATIYEAEILMLPSENAPTSPRVPYGEYTLIKHN